MKKVFALLLSVAMVICMMPSMAFAAQATGITLDQETVTLGVGDTVTLAATLEPDGSDGTVKWSSGDTAKATVNETTGEVEALAEGRVTITAKLDEDAGVKAECTVTVKAKEEKPSGATFEADGTESGTLKNVTNTMKYSIDGGKNYTNISGESVKITSGVSADNDILVIQKNTDGNKVDSDPFTIDVTQGTTPDAATVTGTACTAAGNEDGTITGVTTAMEYKKSDATDWTPVPEPEVGEDAKITGLASGTYYVRAKAADSALASANLEVTIAAGLGGSVSISGILKFGKTLTADISKVTNLTEGKAAYQWKRGGVNIDSATKSTYTLAKEDIGKAITVTVTSSTEGGAITSAATTEIQRADGPIAPTKLVGVAVTTEDGEDGMITGTKDTMEFSNDREFSDEATKKGTCGEGTTTGLAAGTYYVRVKATDTQKAGATATVVVGAFVGATGVSIDGDESITLHVGETKKLAATVTPESCTQKVTWTSSDDTKASVDENGVVTAKVADTVTITATVGDNITDTCTVTVEAKAENTATVSFNANDGTGTMDSINVSTAEQYQLPPCGFTAPANKRFKGWATAAQGTVIVDSKTAVTEAGITLYAIWEDIPTHTLTVNEGTVYVDDEAGAASAAEGATVTIVANEAEEGKVFAGWTVEAGGITLANASSETTTFTMREADVEVTANYKTSGGSNPGGSISVPIVTDPLPAAKTESTNAVQNYVKPADYEEAEAAEIKAIMDKAAEDIKNAKTEEEVKAIEEAAKEAIDKLDTAEEKAVIRTVEATKFRATSKRTTLNGKKAIKITWTVPEGAEFDGYDVFRSTKKNSGFGKKPFFSTKKMSYTNNKGLEAGKTYYYKVRAYKYVNGRKVYSEYSYKAIRTMK